MKSDEKRRRGKKGGTEYLKYCTQCQQTASMSWSCYCCYCYSNDCYCYHNNCCCYYCYYHCYWSNVYCECLEKRHWVDMTRGSLAAWLKKYEHVCVCVCVCVCTFLSMKTCLNVWTDRCQRMRMNVYQYACAHLLTGLLLIAGTVKDEGANALNVLKPTISYGQKKA